MAHAATGRSSFLPSGTRCCRPRRLGLRRTHYMLPAVSDLRRAAVATVARTFQRGNFASLAACLRRGTCSGDSAPLKVIFSQAARPLALPLYRAFGSSHGKNDMVKSTVQKTGTSSGTNLFSDWDSFQTVTTSQHASISARDVVAPIPDHPVVQTWRPVEPRTLGSRDDAMVLNSKITACRTRNEVLALFNSCQRRADSNLNPQHINAFFTTLRKLEGEPVFADPRFVALVEFTCSRFSDADGRGFATVIHCCSRLDANLSGDWLQSFWKSSEAKLPSFNGQDFSNTFLACGKLGVMPSPSWMACFWKWSEAKLPSFKEQGLGNTLWACGKLSVMPPPSWLACYWKWSEAKLSSFDEQNLANMLWACGKLGVMPPPSWMACFWKCSEAKLSSFNGQDFANTLWACGTLGLVPPPSWMACYWKWSEGKLPSFKAQGFANTLWACGTLGAVPPPAWLACYWKCSEAKLSSFNGQNFANTFWACATLSVMPPASWLACYWKWSEAKLPHFNEQNFGNTMWACGKLGMVPPPSWMACYWKWSEAKLPSFSEQSLANTLLSCGTLGLTPPTVWMECFLRSSEAAMPRFSTQNLGNTLFALAMLKQWSSPIVKFIWSAFQRRLADVKHLSDSDRHMDFSQMQLVYLVARAECPGTLLYDDPLLLAEAAQRRAKRSKDGISSSLEERVLKVLIELNGDNAIPFERNSWCDKSEHRIDISLRHPSLRIAIEVDGPSHFIKTAAGAYKPSGETLLRNRLLEGAGWRVLSVQFPVELPGERYSIDKQKLKNDLLALGWPTQQ